MFDPLSLPSPPPLHSMALCPVFLCYDGCIAHNLGDCAALTHDVIIQRPPARLGGWASRTGQGSRFAPSEHGTDYPSVTPIDSEWPSKSKGVGGGYGGQQQLCLCKPNYRKKKFAWRAVQATPFRNNLFRMACSKAPGKSGFHGCEGDSAPSAHKCRFCPWASPPPTPAPAMLQTVPVGVTGSQGSADRSVKPHCSVPQYAVAARRWCCSCWGLTVAEAVELYSTHVTYHRRRLTANSRLTSSNRLRHLPK